MKEEFNSMDIREFGLKCSSKHEVYQQLTVYGNYYLPSEADTNSDYIADRLQERKRSVDLQHNYRFLYGSEIVHVNIPYIWGLRVADIIKFA